MKNFSVPHGVFLVYWMYVNSLSLGYKSSYVVTRSWPENAKESLFNKFVSDVRRSLNKANLFKPFNKRFSINEVDG